MAADDPVTWIEGAERRWRMGLFAPTARLAGCVKALTWYGERWAGPVSRRQVATSGAVVFVTWGAPLEVSLGGTSSSFRAFAAGVQDRPAHARHAGIQEGIGVHLSALGVSRLLGLRFRPASHVRVVSSLHQPEPLDDYGFVVPKPPPVPWRAAFLPYAGVE
jgi:hypothetical protein